MSVENDSQGVDVSSHQKLGTRTPLPGRVARLQIARADFTYFKKGRGRRGPERCQPLSLNTCIFLFLTDVGTYQYFWFLLNLPSASYLPDPPPLYGKRI